MKTATVFVVTAFLVLAHGAGRAEAEVSCAAVKAAMEGPGASASADELAGTLNTTTERVRECMLELQAGVTGTQGRADEMKKPTDMQKPMDGSR